MALVVPAVLPSSRKALFDTLALFARLPHATRVQIDIVDGAFAAPASWPFSAPGELEALAARGEHLPQLHRIEYEIDLMCYEADRAALPWIALGATKLTFHAESIRDLPRFFISLRKRYGGGRDVHSARHLSYGLALNVATDLSILDAVAHEVSYVQLMGIARIGKQGEPFDPRTLERVRTLGARYPELPVQIDGGVTLAHAKELLAQGVSSLVVGSGILRAADPAAAFDAYENLRSPFGV